MPAVNKCKLASIMAFPACLALFVGCASAPEQPPFTTPLVYKDAFAKTKSYVTRCLPGASVRANLYTDVPEGEVIVDKLTNVMIFAPGDFRRADEVVNIHFKGVGPVTEVVAKSQFSHDIADHALTGGACPEAK